MAKPENVDWKEDIIKNRLGGKKEWNAQERMELCHHLDKELDEIPKNLRKGEEEDRWTEQNWRDKLAEHPLFACYLQEEGATAIAPDNPLCDGIAQLKFDSEHSTAKEIAENYKDEGNLYYKNKKYRLAIISYTEGLKQKTLSDDEIVAQLYNNRAACHFKLDNYRSSLNDCEKVVGIDPSYAKSIERAAKCCLKLGLHIDCFSWCDKGINIDSIRKSLIEIREQNKKEKAKADAKQRRIVSIAKKNYEKNQALLKAFKDKKIPVDKSLYLCEVDELNERLSEAPVKRVSTGDLEWDVSFIYPEYHESDLVNEFNEHTRFMTHLKLMFDESRPSWDPEHNYTTENLRVYFTYKIDRKPILVPVDVNSTLATILRDERFPLEKFFPTFIVLSAKSKFQTEFVEQFSKGLDVL